MNTDRSRPHGCQTIIKFVRTYTDLTSCSNVCLTLVDKAISISSMQLFFDFRRHLSIFLRRFMSQPAPEVPVLFTYDKSEMMADMTPYMFQSSLPETTALSMLASIDFYKNESVMQKQHEFLVLQFTHPSPAHPNARAEVIAHRGVKIESGSDKMALFSGSVSTGTSSGVEPLPAVDKVHVIHQPYVLKDTFAASSKEPEKLCRLEYPLPDSNSKVDHQPPNALQMSTLIYAVSEYQREYKLLTNNCFWFSEMVYEATKVLFPGYREIKYPKYAERGTYIHIPMRTEMDALPHVCAAYHDEWKKRPLGSRAVEGLKQDLDEQRRGREEEQRRREEEQRRREEEQRRREEAERRREEAERRREEAERRHEEQRRGREEAERRHEEAERRIAELERRLAEASMLQLQRSGSHSSLQVPVQG